MTIEERKTARINYNFIKRCEALDFSSKAVTRKIEDNFGHKFDMMEMERDGVDVLLPR
jgi:hypothetical protein